jgi:acyl carrier protein
MTPITPDQAAIKLEGYPPELLENFSEFHANKDPEKLDELVLGLLTFLMPEPPQTPLTEYSDDTLLREDLGVDSITISEVVFLIEDLFEISISNEDLMKIETLGDLRGYLRGRLGA